MIRAGQAYLVAVNLEEFNMKAKGFLFNFSGMARERHLMDSLENPEHRALRVARFLLLDPAAGAFQHSLRASFHQPSI